jgi:hypothetical protein
MAAVSGYPNLTVPMGTVAGVPVGRFVHERTRGGSINPFRWSWHLKIRVAARQSHTTSQR